MNRKQVVEQQKLTHVERQNQQIEVILGDIEGAQNELVGVLRASLANPKDEQLKRHVEALEAEIAEHERLLKRCELLKAEAIQLDSAEAKQASLAHQNDLFAAIEERTERQKVLAAQLVAIAESLAPVLAEYDVLAADNQSDTWVLVKAACGGDSRIAERHFPGLVRAVRGAAAIPGVVSAIWASGLGRTGLDLRPWVDISACGAIRPLDEDMDNAADRALGKLRELIEQRKAQVNGAKVKPAPTQADRFIPGGKQLEKAKDESFVAARNGDFTS